MKKLMFAAVAGLCASVFAEGEIASVNIVGYCSTDLYESSGAVPGGAAFVPVSGTAIDLMDLKGTGYEAPRYDEESGEYVGGSNGGIECQILDENGYATGGYMWIDSYIDDGEGNFTLYTGWFVDGDIEQPLSERGTVVVQPGEGWWMNTYDDAQKIQSSGQVEQTAAIEVELLVEGGLMTANPTPVSVDLIDCEGGGYDAPSYDEESGEYVGGSNGNIEAQILDENGYATGGYMWIDSYIDDGEGNFKLYTGWFVDGDIEQPLERGGEGTVVAPGRGFWMNTYDSEVTGKTFVWPKVTIK